MELIIIVLLSGVMPALLQVGIHRITKKKFIMFFIPIVLAIPTFYLSIKYSGVSILAPEAGYALLGFFIGLPAVIGSLLAGIIIVCVKK